MWVHFLVVLHLLASDIQLPGDFNDRLTAITERYVPEVQLDVGERPQLVELPKVAAKPQLLREGESGAGASVLTAQAKRAIVLDAESGAVLLEKNADDPAAMASLAKMMVALVTLEKMDSLDQVLTVPKEIHDLEEYSTLVGFVPGDKVTVGELLRGLVIASGNDAALTLAMGLADTEEDFVELMNDKAERLGMSHTTFVNSSGLDAEGGESTARDLAYLLIEASKVPLLRSTSEIADATIDTENGNSYFVHTTDDLIGQTALDVEFAKTGTTDNAGKAFGILAQERGRRIAVIVLDSPDRFTEAEELVQKAVATFVWPDAIVGAGSEEESGFGG